MKRILLTAAFVVGAAAMALAEEVNVRIDNIDRANGTITSGGVVYILPPNFNDPKLREGNTVRFTYEMKDGKRVITKMMLTD